MAFFCLLFVSACQTLPLPSPNHTRTIPVGQGPEDMVLDTDSSPSLVIACDDRRCKSDCPEGLMLRYDMLKGTLDTLIRVHEPEELSFHPHGIHLLNDEMAKYLFVVNHPTLDSDQIIRYRLTQDSLYFDGLLQSPLYRSPNAVVARSREDFWVSNDRYRKDRLTELIFKQKKSRLVQTGPGGLNREVGVPVAFGNGVLLHQGFLYQAVTRENCIYRYRVQGDSLVGREKWATVSGPDNLRMDGESLIVACHLRSFAFMKHAVNPGKISPSAVYRIPFASGSPELLFFDSGDRLSAGSTAIIFQNKLFISQVFEHWILEVDLLPAVQLKEN